MREYNGGLTREQFLFYEIRIMASLVSQGYTKAEAIEKIKEENLLGLLNSKLILHFMKMLSQTMNFEVNQVGSVPVFEELASEQVNKLVQENISTSKDEWDSYETSWDFKKHPLV